MKEFNRLNAREVVAQLMTGIELNIGNASIAARARVRYHAKLAGFKVAMVKCGEAYIASSTGKL